ncbi:hypothetical protein CAP35_00210 [Chitinophagaceae bacterium IBVUCB1]|nr:hypothetical protein CAP35_00210 [Chitinophagaceae bacterium IBVUCB1]
MKIFSASQIKACDAYTIHAAHITSINLMERAAAACTEWLIANMPKDSIYILLCGSGNNGGDGLAIARMLHQTGYSVKAFLLNFSGQLSEDCQTNLQRLQSIDNNLVELLQPDVFITDIPSNIIIIDAILGTGLNRAVEGWIAQFIDHINQLTNTKIAIDIPSGMPADMIPANEGDILKVNHTLSFQLYKRTFLHPETGSYAGKITLLDIGLHPTFIASTHTNYQTIDEEKIKTLYKKRAPFTHKGDYGTALIVAGSNGMIGAATLAAKATLRSGAGKVKVLLPQIGYGIVQSSVPEAMCITSGENHISKINCPADAQCIGIGPGIGTHDYTIKAFADFIEQHKNPLVLDADALNILAKQPELLHKVPAGSILTPHPKEYERLFGKTNNTMQQAEHARTQAMRYNIYIILKGHHTAIATPEGECWYCTNGNAGMATAGSGDVLTGIVTGLMAQGYNSYDAALLGVYLHAKAGDLAASKYGQQGMIAGDIIKNIGEVWKEIERFL